MVAATRATDRRVARIRGVTGTHKHAVDNPPHSGAPCIAEVFHAHHLELVRLATLLVGDRPTAEDVVQDVFTRLHARWDRVTGRDVLPYARASVVNGCRSVQRRRRIARRLGGAREPAPRQETAESAESAALVAEDRRRVLAALAALPPRRQEVLVLRYYLGLSEAEIASVLGIAPGTVKSTAARGLVALARRIGEDR
jgi:RNA polymerase sigma-70 factor (sigma-E family)